MSDPEITDLPATWRTWIQVFADLRQLPLETATHGWWLDVGRRQQAARYFLTEIDLALFRDLASSIEEPAVHLEMLAPRQIVEALLPEGWSLAASEYLMTAAIEPECIPAVPEDVQLVLDGDDDGIRAGCLDRDGHALSRGICGVIGRGVPSLIRSLRSRHYVGKVWHRRSCRSCRRRRAATARTEAFSWQPSKGVRSMRRSAGQSCPKCRRR